MNVKKQITNKIEYGLTKKVALFTNARDESHIKEWAAHHLLIGFDYIIIFDHKSNIPLTEVFKNFDKRVTTIKCNMENPIKIKLMNESIKYAKKLKVDWFIYLDADEFIILHNKFKGVKHLLNCYGFSDSLGINWLIFGSNNFQTEPENILGSYTKSELHLNSHVKSFVRPYEAVRSDNPHFYHIKNKNKAFGLDKKMSGPFNDYNMPFNVAPAYIAHFVNQSEETYIKRKLKLPADDTGKFRVGNSSHIHSSYNDVENQQPKIKYYENVQAFLQQYAK
jgi:hypothetical protein